MQLLKKLSKSFLIGLLCVSSAFAGLETATYISGLVATNPTSGDPVSQGDDHARLIKSTLLNTFPSITGAVTVSHTDLNKVTKIPGIDQTWQDLTASRAVNTSYTNSTSKPISVSVSVTGNTSSSTLSISFTVGATAGINSTSVIVGATASNTTLSAAVVVPPATTYQLDVTQGTLLKWTELR